MTSIHCFSHSVNSNTGSSYGVCSTEAATAAKTVTTSKGNFDQTTGSSIIIKFTNGNTAANITLNVNNTGAAPIYYNGAAISTELDTNGTYLFIFNGAQFDLIGGTGGGSADVGLSVLNGQVCQTYETS